MSYAYRNNSDIELHTERDNHSYSPSYNHTYHHYPAKPDIPLYIYLQCQVAQHCRLPYTLRSVLCICV